MKESIFTDLDISGYAEISAVRNISAFYDGKSVMTTLDYTDGLTHVRIGSTLEMDSENNLDAEKPVKLLLLVRQKDSDRKISERVWPKDFCAATQKDLDFVNKLFDNFNDELKKVYL